jgi:hypothetical protein
MSHECCGSFWAAVPWRRDDSGRLMPTDRVIPVREWKSLCALEEEERSAILQKADRLPLDLYEIRENERFRLRRRD